MKNANMPINPTLELNGQGLLEDTSYGLTKREYFAAMALQGLCAHSGDYHAPEHLASDAVMFADAVLAELERTNEPD